MSSIYKPENVLRLGDSFRWPGDKKTAVVIDVAYECWSDGSYSGIGPMGNVLKGSWRVHVGHFVLMYVIEEEKKVVRFYKFEHHDKAYQ